jgi:hypothetical protein
MKFLNFKAITKYGAIEDSVSSKVATVAVLLGLVPNFEKYFAMVWFCFGPTETENHFSKILPLFSDFFFKFLEKYENSV